MKYIFINRFTEYLAIVAISVFLNFLINVYVFTTDGEVWKKEAIEAIQHSGELERNQKQYENKVKELIDDLNNIRKVHEVDSVMRKHGI